MSMALGRDTQDQMRSISSADETREASGELGTPVGRGLRGYVLCPTRATIDGGEVWSESYSVML